MAAYGLQADDVSGLLDTLTYVSQQTGISVSDLASQMSTNAGSLTQMGLSAEGAASFLGQVSMSGADSTAVMTGLKTALKNATDQGVPLTDALSQIQDSITNATSPTEGLNKAIELFGTKAGPTIYNACEQGTLSFTELGNTALTTGETVNDTFANTQDPADQFKLVLNQLQQLGYELGNTLGPVLAQALQLVVPVIQDLTAWWQGLSPEMQNIIMVAVALVAAIGPVIIFIGKLSTGISAIIDIIPTLTSVWGTLVGAVQTGSAFISTAIDSIPFFGWVALAVTAFTLLYTKCEWFRDGVNAIISGVVDWFKEKLDAITGFFNKLDFKFPHINLPHFSMSGSFSLVPFKVPKISVDWYAKGGILDGSTIFGMNGSSLMGGGEKGKEAVLPLADFYTNLERILTSSQAGATYNNNLTVNVAMTGTSDTDIKALANRIGDELANQITRKEAVFS